MAWASPNSAAYRIITAQTVAWDLSMIVCILHALHDWTGRTDRLCPAVIMHVHG